ncbi:hypothetical protein D3C72_2057830 [compost metagenome]
MHDDRLGLVHAIQRLAGAPNDGRGQAELLTQEQRIARCRGDIGIADNGGDPQQVDFRQLAEIEQRHGIVDAGIGIKNDFHRLIRLVFRPHAGKNRNRL